MDVVSDEDSEIAPSQDDVDKGAVLHADQNFGVSGAKEGDMDVLGVESDTGSSMHRSDSNISRPSDESHPTDGTPAVRPERMEDTHGEVMSESKLSMVAGKSKTLGIIDFSQITSCDNQFSATVVSPDGTNDKNEDDEDGPDISLTNLLDVVSDEDSEIAPSQDGVDKGAVLHADQNFGVSGAEEGENEVIGVESSLISTINLISSSPEEPCPSLNPGDGNASFHDDPSATLVFSPPEKDVVRRDPTVSEGQ